VFVPKPSRRTAKRARNLRTNAAEREKVKQDMGGLRPFIESDISPVADLIGKSCTNVKDLRLPAYESICEIFFSKILGCTTALFREYSKILKENS
jgi:hypothetical protein